eukprot:CAMPEP_0170187748 /NCGR_PEP_ID=MMETSP0040_2-20121228/42508_1 /TAXON_ID=641309 /ORGANISM="Lotharella oceanica, Strain CCMP622" /LENGTH=53 /DNA_ID=CAMNT_0010434855 /DNA_START=28 /DNA_END=186 /DNA_ORIENTATION=-
MTTKVMAMIKTATVAKTTNMTRFMRMKIKMRIMMVPPLQYVKGRAAAAAAAAA